MAIRISIPTMKNRAWKRNEHFLLVKASSETENRLKNFWA